MVRSQRPSSRARALFMVWSVLACGAGSAACAALFGFERLSEEGFEGGAPGEASVEGGDAPPFEAGPSCTELGVPDRPAAVDAGTDAPESIHMAIRMIDFGIDKAAAAAGFNLDRACSPNVETNTCATSIDQVTFEKYGKDKDDKGLDNSGYGLIAYLAYLGAAFAPTSVNERLTLGEFGAVIRLANWNGTSQDDDVFVEIFPAIGVWKPRDGGVPEAGGVPSFTAGDEWRRDRRFQKVGLEASTIKSASAWVTGGRLVASFQSVTMPITVPDDMKPLDIILHEVFFTGMLVPDGTSWKVVQGVLGGRWRTVDMLGQVRTIFIKDTTGLKNVHLCDPNLPINIYGAVKTEVCDGRDLRSASREDGKGLPCDAFSAGIKLDTYAVNMPGPFADLPVIPARCQQDGSVPVGDDCAPATE